MLPYLNPTSQSRVVTDTFAGYNHRLNIGLNEFFHTQNLSTEQFPMLASRHARGEVMTVSNPGGLIAKDALVVVDGDAVIFGGVRIPLGLNDVRPKQLVSMGAYLVIFPDKKYFNTADTEDHGDLEAHYTSAAGVPVSYAPCDVNGNVYTGISVQPDAPENPAGGALWMDNGAEQHALMQWSESSSMWVQIPTVYTRISAAGIGKLFGDYDGVTLSGTAYDGDPETGEQVAALSGEHVIYKRGDDFIVIVGLLDEAVTSSSPVTVERLVPDMDYVCEAGNRLWGCKYGLVGGAPVNEIYGSKLGDFKNWRCFAGISTDSYAASVGSDGQWTSAVNYLGYPTFFKENRIHRVYIASSGAHQVVEQVGSGVQKGSWRSPAVAGELLFYKGRGGVYAYDGSQPVLVSDNLGSEAYHSAVGGAVSTKYYISMADRTGAHHMFAYDTERKLWMREDDTNAMMFAEADGDLFWLTQDGRLICAGGSQGEAEKNLEWAAESGVQHYELPDRKYVSRYNFRVRLPVGSVMRLFLRYDSGEWEPAGELVGRGLSSYVIPVIPRRCDHLEFRLEGSGEFQLFSITRVIEQGSDGA